MLPLFLQLGGQDMRLFVIIQPLNQLLSFFMGLLDAIFQHLSFFFEGYAFDLEPSDGGFQDIYDLPPFLRDTEGALKLILIDLNRNAHIIMPSKFL